LGAGKGEARGREGDHGGVTEKVDGGSEKMSVYGRMFNVRSDENLVPSIVLVKVGLLRKDAVEKVR
jgi:hypothetical protein